MDSVDKVVNVYFAAFATEPFTYKGELFNPKPLFVSTSFFHSFNCFANCGGCCQQFTLDFIPGETMPTDEKAQQFHNRQIEFNGRPFTIITKDEHDPNHHIVNVPSQKRCDFMRLTDGRCDIHMKHPLTCDFAGLMVWHRSDFTWCGVRPFGRRWAMMKLDGIRGGDCTITKTPTDANREENIRRLERLKEWTDFFGIKTHIPNVIDWAKQLSDHSMCFKNDKDGNSFRVNTMKEPIDIKLIFE